MRARLETSHLNWPEPVLFAGRPEQTNIRRSRTEEKAVAGYHVQITPYTLSNK